MMLDNLKSNTYEALRVKDSEIHKIFELWPGLIKAKAKETNEKVI